MSRQQLTLFQAYELVEEKQDAGLGTADIDLFFAGPDRTRICVACGSDFEPPLRSKANVCSEACRRVRQLRYGASYRQEIREKRAQLRAMFGGREPTEEDFMRLVQQRKAGK